MSINIGTAAVEAVKSLASNSYWQVVLSSLEETVRTKANQALDGSDPRAIGYAAGLRDLHQAFVSATSGSLLAQTKKVNVTGGKPNAA